MKISKHPFGIVSGNQVYLYCLSNDQGMEVAMMTYGATITSIEIPDKQKGKRNIVCGFDHLDGYFSDAFKQNAPYFGATIGRYCATIQNGAYDAVELGKNIQNTHTLHGGIVGFDKKIWAVDKVVESLDYCAIHLRLLSPDGDQGFPGNVWIGLTVMLNNQNALSFRYSAVSDVRTPLSLTNHSYFNLSGFTENIEGHTAQIFADNIFPMDAAGSYAENIKPVEQTKVDYRTARRIGNVHQQMGDGMEHFYLFPKGVTTLAKHVAHFEYAPNQSAMDVYTTEPGMLFYTAKYTSDKFMRETGEKFGKHCAFCCETHRIPNGPNIKNAPDVFVKPGERFISETIYKFEY